MGLARALAALLCAAGAGAIVTAVSPDGTQKDVLLGVAISALAALALANLVRSLLPPGALIGPATLAAGAGVLFVARGEMRTDVPYNLIAWLSLAGLLIAAAIVLVPFSRSANDVCHAVAWVTLRNVTTVSRDLRVLSVLGNARLDLSRCASAPDEIHVHCRILGGRADLVVPASWRVVVDARSTARLVRLAETGMPKPDSSAPLLTIELTGAWGGIGLHRR